jgi:hypothetical protein
MNFVGKPVFCKKNFIGPDPVFLTGENCSIRDVDVSEKIEDRFDRHYLTTGYLRKREEGMGSVTPVGVGNTFTDGAHYPFYNVHTTITGKIMLNYSGCLCMGDNSTILECCE